MTMTTEIGMTESCGNVFLDLGFPPDEAVILALRADLMAGLRLLIRDQGWTPIETAQHFGISQARVSDLVSGKWDKFSLDMLITLTVRAGKRVELRLVA